MDNLVCSDGNKSCLSVWWWQHRKVVFLFGGGNIEIVFLYGDGNIEMANGAIKQRQAHFNP